MRIFMYLMALLPVLYAQYSSSPYRNQVQMISNFNFDKSSSHQHSPIRLQQPLPLPIILTNPGQYKSNRPLFQKYSLRKYQLYDTNYLPDLSKITRLDEQLAYNMEPPTGVFQQSSKIVIQNYRLLQIKEFKITLINPSQRFRFCVEEIFIDSQEITRQQKRPLPFCINSTTKYPFFFTLYITQHKPLIFKGTVYFILTIYDGEQLVDQKIWPKQIIVKVTHNHLRIIPLEIRNCNKDNSIVMIRNPEKWDLSLVIIYKRKLYELTGQPIDGNIVIPAQKSYKFIIDGKDSKMTIYTKSVAVDIVYPVLYIPIYCIQDLIVDYFNIGILSDDRSLLEFPVTVSSYSNNSIYIQQISLKSSTQTVELLPLRENYNNYEIQPNVRHFIVARIIIHGSKVNVQAQRSYFEVGIKYMMQVDPKLQITKKQGNQNLQNLKPEEIEFQVRQTRTTYHYCQMRSPVSVGTKRFIDISKLGDAIGSVSENAFPIRNNLNLPINLIRVIYDQSKFKLLWLQDRRDYIFPNHQRDQFSLQYIGPRNLQISPMKYIALLQFNGNLFIPLEVVIYDRTLQCVAEDIENGKPIKCSDLPIIQFGYFNQPPLQQPQLFEQTQKDRKQQSNSTSQSVQDKKTEKNSQNNDQQDKDTQRGNFLQNMQPPRKIRRVTIRNWNPEPKNVKVGIQQNSVQKYGFNTTVKILGPYPNYDVLIRSEGNIHELYLKGNHYIILQIQMTPLLNATSGTLPLRILTSQQHITKPIKFKVENGTIALIPQISRFQSSYKKTIEYLNLVSTYKEPYRIKSIHSNASNLMVYCNNYSEIYENQWIGMALIYQPFGGEWNISEDCCGQKKGIQRLFKQLRTGGIRPIPVQITLRTSTELQANALVLIDRSSAPLIQLPYSHQFSIREKFRKDAQRIDIHLIDDGNIDRFQYKLKLKNIFEETLKGNILIFDEQIIQRLQQYMQYRSNMNEKVTNYFCLRNDVKVKHSFTPSLIKSLFHLPNLPLEITVQPLTNTSFYINSPLPPRQQVVDANKFSEYFRQTIKSGSRMCYRFQAALFLKNLIQTGVINWFSQEYRYEVLSQFVRKQFQQLQFYQQNQQTATFPFPHSKQSGSSIKYTLKYQEFFSQHYIDKEHFCKGERNQDKMTALFKFCQHINIKMKYLEPNQKKYQRKQQKTVVRLQQCSNSTNSDKKQSRDCRKDLKQNGKRIRKTYQKQVNRYFLLPAQQKKTKDKPETKQRINQLELGFQIFPIKNRAPIFTFATNQYRATIQNPALSREALQSLNKEEQVQYMSRKANFNSGEDSQDPLFLTTPSFYLILLNNYTSYQLYHQTIQISKPKLKVKSVIINGQKIQKRQFEDNYFRQEFQEIQNKESFVYKQHSTKQAKNKHRKNISSQRNKWLPIYIDQSQIRRKTQIDEFQKNEKDSLERECFQQTEYNNERATLNFQYNPEVERLKVKQMINSFQIQNLVVEGQKVFQIINEGQADILYTHIGFQNQQLTCIYKGLQIITGPCTDQHKYTNNKFNEMEEELDLNKNELNLENEKKQKQAKLRNLISYKLLPKSSSLLKIRYSIPLLNLIDQNQKNYHNNEKGKTIKSKQFNVYLYNSDSYYIQLVVKFKFSVQLQKSLRSLQNLNNRSGNKDKFFITNFWNITLNMMALVFVCATIFKFKQADDMSKRILSKRSSQQSNSSQIGNSKLQYSSNNSISNSQKMYKKLKMKSDFYGQQTGTHSQNGQLTYHIIQPSAYQYTIGSIITTKATTGYHPIVTISEDYLNSIKQQQKKELKMLHNFFNQSEQSEILAKNQHQLHQNISLTINLDEDHTENQNHQNQHNQSVSEDSSFDFQIRNTSRSQEQQIRKHKKEVPLQSSSGSDFSQASESDLPQGEQVQITAQVLDGSGQEFGFESQSKKKTHVSNSQTQQQESQEKKEGYYNAFFTDNPLKKTKQQGGSNNPFSWMNQNKKRSRLKW